MRSVGSQIDHLLPHIILRVVRPIQPVTSQDRFGCVKKADILAQDCHIQALKRAPSETEFPKKVGYGAGGGMNNAFGKSTQNAKFCFSNTLRPLLPPCI